MKKVVVFILSVFWFGFAYSQCIMPTSLSITSTTDSSATLSIVTTGTSPWQVQYGNAGFSLGTGTTININSKTPTVGGLAGSTTYDIYVRDTCNGTVSIWVGPYTFSTNCTGIAQAPFYTGFESSDWVPSNSIVQPGTLAACWNVNPPASLFSWSVGPGFYIQNLTGPYFDHTTGSGKYVHVGSYGQSTDLKTSLQLPVIDLSGSVSPRLEFWYHMYGGGIEKMMILIKKLNSTAWDTLQVLSGEQHSSKTDVWKKSVILLSGYSNDTVQVEFVGTRASYSPYIEMAIDDLYIGDKPTCPASTLFQVISTTHNSVTLDWQPDSTTHWQIEFDTAGFTPGTGSLLQTAVHPFSISGLQTNTIYEFYLRDSCGVNDIGSWIGPISTRTHCLPIIAPFIEDFEDSAWVSPTVFGQVGKIDTCWIRDAPKLFFWEAGPALYQYLNTGPSGDHTTGSGKYLVTDRYSSWGTSHAHFRTPWFDLDSLVNPELTFWYHMYGTTVGGLEVAIDSGSGFHSLLSLVGQQQFSNTDPWKEAVLNLGDYAGKTVSIRFTGITAFTISNLSRIGIDDFSLHDAPTCPKPILLEVEDLSRDHAKLTWHSGGASNWNIKYKPLSGSFTTISVNTNPYVLSGLQADTEYEVWIRDSCGIGNTSVWNGPFYFATLCDPLPTPYYEDFESSGFSRPQGYLQSGTLNSCWRRERDDGFYWETGPPYFVTMNSGPMGDHTTGGGKYLVSDLITFVGHDSAYITSPQIDLTNLTDPEFSYWYHMFGTGIYALQIEIDSGTGWHLLDTIYGQQQLTKSAPWKERIISLSNYADDTITLRFVSIRQTYYNNAEISLDDLQIYEARTCEKPTNFKRKNVRSAQATFSWTKGSGLLSTLRYKTPTGSFSYINTTSNSAFTISNLQPDTQYEVWVRDSCGSNEVSLWVGPIVFKTNCTPSFAPFIEDFEDASWQPASITNNRGEVNSCWKISDTTYL